MTLRVDVLTLFPDAVAHYATTSVLGRAAERGVWSLHLHDFRDATTDVHRSVDDTPFGGGAGMVLRAEPIISTIESVTNLARPVIALTPSGRVFTHEVARELSELAGFTLLSGRYEGFDQRVLDLVVDDEISLGDFVLAGGELAALCVIESVVRLLRGALGNDDLTGVQCGARVQRGRVLQSGTPRVPAVHEARRDARRARAGGPALGRPRENRPVAPRAGVTAHHGTSARPHDPSWGFECARPRNIGRIPYVG